MTPTGKKILTAALVAGGIAGLYFGGKLAIKALDRYLRFDFDFMGPMTDDRLSYLAHKQSTQQKVNYSRQPKGPIY